MHNNEAPVIKISLTREEALSGCTRQITVDGSMYRIRIPAGTENGDMIQINSASGETLCMVEASVPSGTAAGGISGGGSGGGGTSGGGSGGGGTSGGEKDLKKYILPAICIIAVLVIAIGLIAHFAPEPDPVDPVDPPSPVDPVEPDEPTVSPEDAFRDYIAEVIATADEFDEGHPVQIDSNGVDRITWEAYGIEDFDGDGDIELLALRSFYRIGGKLTLYEYEDGNVREGRSVWFLGGIEDLRSTAFYSNGVGFLSYDAIADSGHTEYVYLLTDSYDSYYNLGSEQYMSFAHDEEGNIWYNTGPDYLGDDQQMSQSEYEEYTQRLHFDEEYSSYWMLSPEFTEITQ